MARVADRHQYGGEAGSRGNPPRRAGDAEERHRHEPPLRRRGADPGRQPGQGLDPARSGEGGQGRPRLRRRRLPPRARLRPHHQGRDGPQLRQARVLHAQPKRPRQPGGKARRRVPHPSEPRGDAQGHDHPRPHSERRNLGRQHPAERARRGAARHHGDAVGGHLGERGQVRHHQDSRPHAEYLDCRISERAYRPLHVRQLHEVDHQHAHPRQGGGVGSRRRQLHYAARRAADVFAHRQRSGRYSCHAHAGAEPGRSAKHRGKRRTQLLRPRKQRPSQRAVTRAGRLGRRAYPQRRRVERP